jgi:hypothetical protein
VFPQRTPDQLFNHRFAFTARLEIQQIKEFFRDRGGRTWAFYLPSWKRDVTLAEPTAAGTKLINIISPDENYEETHFDDTDLDHHGRYLFFFREGFPVFGIDIIRVLPGLRAGENQLDLDLPLPFDVDQNTLVGWCYLVRFVEDQVVWTHYSPDHAETEIAFRATRRANQNDITQPIEQINQYGQLGFVEARLAPGIPEPTTNRVSYSLGPWILHNPQDELFYTPWAAWPHEDGVRLKKLSTYEEIWLPNDSGTASTLFSGPVLTDHLSLTFDQNSWEVVAYQKASEQIELRRFFNFATDIRTWTGIDPILQFNGLLSVGLATGDRDVVCYYLRTDGNSLYMRFQRDNFAIEYVAALLPSRPLALKQAYYERDDTGLVGTLYVEYLDAGLRVCALRSAAYDAPPPPPPPPLLPEVIAQAANPDRAGVTIENLVDYYPAVVYTDGESYEAIHQPSIEPTSVHIENVIDYVPVVIYFDGLAFDAKHIPLKESTGVTIENIPEYINVTIKGDNQLETNAVIIDNLVSYTLSAIQNPARQDQTGVTIDNIVSYEPA